MSYQVICNSSLKGVQQSVRAAALEDFEFFADTVLCSRLGEEVCDAVQEAVLLKETCYFRYPSSRTLATALYFYLKACGYLVLSDFQPLSQSEMLAWLDLESSEEDVDNGTGTTGAVYAISLTLHRDGVSLSWL